jgi:hypothetical protein
VRLVVTAPDGQPGNVDIVANVDVYDAGAGVTDDWLFLGDSIMQDAMGHDEVTIGGTDVGTFSQLVNARRPAYFPLQQNGGIGGVTSRVAADHIADWLALSPAAS